MAKHVAVRGAKEGKMTQTRRKKKRSASSGAAKILSGHTESEYNCEIGRRSKDSESVTRPLYKERHVKVVGKAQAKL